MMVNLPERTARGIKIYRGEITKKESFLQQFLRRLMIGISDMSKNYRVRTHKAKRLRMAVREDLHKAIELILLSNGELAERALSSKDFIRERIQGAV
ncbi:hypothetical protein C5S31_06575 [ANME-1 cluster archaeon GoMg2]|nr:hypothetical protein [ANME-1 cluster archaeon GoMg2]